MRYYFNKIANVKFHKWSASYKWMFGCVMWKLIYSITTSYVWLCYSITTSYVVYKFICDYRADEVEKENERFKVITALILKSSAVYNMTSCSVIFTALDHFHDTKVLCSCFNISHEWLKVKWSRYRPGVAQRVGRGIALLFHDRGTRSSTLRPQFTPRKDPVTTLQ